MKMADLVVLKIGGSVLTKKSLDKAEIDYSNLARISSEIKNAQDKGKFSLVVVHGAGPFGHIPVKEYGLDKVFKGVDQLAGVVKTRQMMQKLNLKVVESLNKAGLYTVAFQPSAAGLLSDGILCDFRLDLIERFLSIGVVPVCYGDLLLDEKRGVAVLSGDILAPYLALKLKAEMVVLAADVRGIYSADPAVDVKAEFIPKLSIKDIDGIDLTGSRSTDVTGGMKGKIRALKDAANQDVEIQVISGIEPGFVEKALLGEHVGTKIKP